MRDLPNLDFLRACAVLSVLLQHISSAYGVQYISYWKVSWIGTIGVFLFFVHTCLVLMWSLERRPHALDFYVRRIFRIYPLAITCVIVVWLTHAPVGSTMTEYFHYSSPHGISDVLAGLLLIPNFFYKNYLPMGVLWSLPYELDMYVCLPLLFFFVQKNFSVWPLLFFWIFENALCRTLFGGSPHNFFLAVPYFLPGVIAYVGFGRWKAIFPSWTLPLFLLGLWGGFMVHPGWRIGGLLCLIAGLALPLFHQIKARWFISASHNIAKYSFGLYLSHPFAIVLGLRCLPRAPLVLQVSVILSSATIMSIIGYHLIEHPMIQFGGKIANKLEKRFRQHQLAEYRIPPAEIA